MSFYNYAYNNQPYNTWSNNMPYRGYTQPLQPLQPLNEVQTNLSVQFGTVNSKDDMDLIQPQLNVIYFGINKGAKEIYTKQLNNNGLIDSHIYTQTSNEISKDSNQSILECLERIESKLNRENQNERNVTTINATNYDPKSTRESDLWDVPTNDER